MSAILKYESKIEEILKARQDKIDSLGESIYEARQKLDRLQGEMMEATARGDIQGHVDLSFEKDRVERELKALRLQKDIIENDDRPLVTDGEYKAGVSEIMQEVGRISKEDKKEMLSLIRQIAEVGERNRRIVNRCNDVLKNWQEKIYMNLDRKMKLNNGRVILLEARAEVKDRSVSNFAREVCNGHYAKMFEIHVEGEKE